MLFIVQYVINTVMMHEPNRANRGGGMCQAGCVWGGRGGGGRGGGAGGVSPPPHFGSAPAPGQPLPPFDTWLYIPALPMGIPVITTSSWNSPNLLRLSSVLGQWLKACRAGFPSTPYNIDVKTVHCGRKYFAYSTRYTTLCTSTFFHM